MWAKWLPTPCHLGAPHRSVWGQKQKWLHNPCCLRGPCEGPTCGPTFFVIWGGKGGGGGLKSWRRQALFQGRRCFCPTPTPGGRGPAQEAGTHSLPCPQWLPNIQPHSTFIMNCEKMEENITQLTCKKLCVPRMDPRTISSCV